MTQPPAYTPYHPHWYRERVSTYWWLGQWKYLKFILRELSSIFVAWFVLVTLLGLAAVGRGPESYAEFLDWLRRPWVLLVNAVSFFFLVFHTITWFIAAPQALAVRIGGKRVPDWMIALPNYAAWFLISALVGWLVLSG